MCAASVRVVTTGARIKAVATARGMSESAMTETGAAFSITTAAPSISPDGGTFEEGVEVVLTSVTLGAVLRYTLDGSQPTAESAIYEGPLRIERTGTELQVLALAPHMDPSPVLRSRPFTIEAAPPRIRANGTKFAGQTEGVEGFVESAVIYMRSRTVGASVWYRIVEASRVGAVRPSDSDLGLEGWVEYDPAGEGVPVAEYGEAWVEAYAEAPGTTTAAATMYLYECCNDPYQCCY